MEKGIIAIIKMMICLICLVMISSFTLSAPAVACTTFVIGKGANRLFGKSFDFTFGDGYLMVNKRGMAKSSYPSQLPGENGRPARWISKYGSVTFNQYGREFPMGGINETGLIVESMMLKGTEYPLPDSRPYIAGALLWGQHILDTCASAEDVSKSDAKVRISLDASKGSQVHFLVLDRRGNAAVIEFLDGRMVVHREDTLPVIALTNSRYESAVAYWKHRSFPAPDEWSSIHRFVTAANLTGYDVLIKPGSNLNFAFDVLTAVTWVGTRWSIVYDNQKMNIHFRTDMNPKIRMIDIKQVDFSCKTLVKVLNINAERSGDVTRDFVDYTPVLNMDLVKTSFEKLKPIVSVPPEVAAVLGIYPEKCQCVK
jgi:penicillin V acylase-like amidase (Ntn superfamily)